MLLFFWGGAEHIYIYIYIYIYMYTYTYIYVYIYIHVCTYTCIYIHIYTYMYIRTCMYVHLSLSLSLYIYISALRCRRSGVRYSQGSGLRVSIASIACTMCMSRHWMLATLLHIDMPTPPCTLSAPLCPRGCCEYGKTGCEQ